MCSFSSRRRHTRLQGDWSSDVCSSDLRKLWELRSERGDDRGAAECLIRLAELPEADAETQLTGARAARALGETARAAARSEERRVGNAWRSERAQTVGEATPAGDQERQ